MEWFEVIARLVLAATFLMAGISKARDLEGVADAAQGLGVPASAAPLVARALPVTEVILGAGLLFTPTAFLAQLGLAVLLTVFSAALIRVIAHGDAVVCRCFGEVSDEPVGWPAVGRNVALLLATLILLASGDQLNLASWAEGLDSAERWALGLALFSALLLAMVQRLAFALRRVRRDLADAGGPGRSLRRGQTMPEFTVVSPENREITSVALTGASAACVVVFISETCAPCHEMLPELGAWQRSLADRFALHVISDGPNSPEPTRVLVSSDSSAHELCRIPATPSAFAVDGRGVVTHGTVSGSVAIEALVRSI